MENHHANQIEAAIKEASGPKPYYQTFVPVLGRDGNQWCALYGEDLHSGIAGFGDSPALALLDFEASFNQQIKTASKD